MSIEESSQEFIYKYQKSVKRLFATEDGKFVLNALRNAYVDTSCLTAVSEHTHYYLGKKELVMELIEDFNRELPDEGDNDGNIKLDGDILDA